MTYDCDNHASDVDLVWFRHGWSVHRFNGSIDFTNIRITRHSSSLAADILIYV